MSYQGGDRAEFGIIDDFDPQKDYDDSYEPERYHCIAICDDALNDWWDDIQDMRTYFHCYNRPETALARWGVTLIPPESLGQLKLHTTNSVPRGYFVVKLNLPNGYLRIPSKLLMIGL